MLWKIYVHENLKVKSSQLRETRIFCDDRHQKHHTVKLNRKKLVQVTKTHVQRHNRLFSRNSNQFKYTSNNNKNGSFKNQQQQLKPNFIDFNYV